MKNLEFLVTHNLFSQCSPSEKFVVFLSMKSIEQKSYGISNMQKTIKLEINKTTGMI